MSCFPGVDGTEEAWNPARMESGRTPGKAGGISGVLFMGSPVFGSVSIVRREGTIFGKRWIAAFGFRGLDSCDRTLPAKDAGRVGHPRLCADSMDGPPALMRICKHLSRKRSRKRARLV